MKNFMLQIESWFGCAVLGRWDTIAFLAEEPDSPFLTRWGWWD